MREGLDEVSRSFNNVVCEILLRDIQNLIERYLRKMRKSFARMYWDEADDDHNEEESIPPVPGNSSGGSWWPLGGAGTEPEPPKAPAPEMESPQPEQEEPQDAQTRPMSGTL